MDTEASSKACCFTGHRPHRFVFGDNENDPLCIRIKESLRSSCELLYQQDNVRVFLTGCGLGVDQWAGEEVLRLRDTKYPDFRLVCVAPFPHFVDRWSDGQKARLRKIWDAADVKGCVRRVYTSDVYALRNQHMVDRSHYVIAVYERGGLIKGGTAMTVGMANTANRNIILISPSTGEVTFE